MTKTDLDWSFDDAPDEPQPAPEGLAVAGPPRRRRRGPEPRTVRRWAIITGALVLLAVLGAWVAARLGWQRLERQVTAEVLYEAEHAAAGESGLALTVWAQTGEEIHAFRQLHTALAEAGLSAPLPAAHLTPSGGPPTVISVTLLADDLFAAQVARAYMDSDGQPVTFTLTQRYRSLGGGLWERLPPELAPLAATTLVQGQYLSATVLVADLPWLADSLLRADLALAQACHDWGDLCPADSRLDIIFTAHAQYLLTPLRPGAGPAAGLGPYPAALAVRPATPVLHQPLWLPSLALTGAPADEAAQAALTRALTAHGLAYLAQVVSGTNTRPNDYFFDALVGRAEQRLGLAAPLTYTVRAQDFMPLEILWQAAQRREGAPAPGALPLQLQALKFVNEALAGLPPETDGALLADLRRQDDVLDWLSGALGRVDAQRAVGAWRREAEAALVAASGLTASRLEGLLYTCASGTYQITGGANVAQPFALPATGLSMMQAGAISPDGRYVATIVDLGASVISLLDRATGLTRQVELLTGVYLAGWTAGGGLVYIQQADTELDPTGQLGQAMRLDPQTGERVPLAEALAYPMFLPDDPWLPDRTGLVLGLWDPALGEPGPWTLAPSLLLVDQPGQPPRRLAQMGYGAVVSPDARWVAFGLPTPLADTDWRLLDVAAVDLQTGAQTAVVSAASLAAANNATPEYVFPMLWSPDSEWLLALAGGANYPTSLYALPRTGGVPRTLIQAGSSPGGFYAPVGFGADGRTLAVIGYEPESESQALTLAYLDGAPPVLLARDVQWAAWSPDGALLAMAGLSGVRVTDPATGLWRWVTVEQCQGVQWE